MHLIIQNRSEKPIYEQIIEQIKSMIINQELSPGDPLPSMRGLAKDLHISLITVKKAYEELSKEGFIETIVGKGSFVGSIDSHWLLEQKQKEIEAHLEKAIQIAKQYDISYEILQELLEMIHKGSD